MQFYIKTSHVFTKKNIGKDSTIVCLSDLHYTSNNPKYILVDLLYKIDSIQPDYICFLGDLVDDDSYQIVINWLNSLAKIAPVYFVYGNHDIEKYIINDKKYYVPSALSTKVKDAIRNIDNLTVLANNKMASKNGFSFCGANFYDNSRFNQLIKYLNDKYPHFSSVNFNILLSHNPGIMNSVYYKQLNQIYRDSLDLIISGHTHNGLVPRKIDKIIPGTKGIYLKAEGLFPKYVRNETVLEDNNKGIIVPPIRTLPDRGRIINKANEVIYRPGMQLIRIKKD